MDQSGKGGGRVFAAIVIFVAGVLVGGHSGGSESPTATQPSGVTVGDLEQVCSVLKEHDPDSLSGLSGCDAAVQMAIDDMVDQARNDRQFEGN